MTIGTTAMSRIVYETNYISPRILDSTPIELMSFEKDAGQILVQNENQKSEIVRVNLTFELPASMLKLFPIEGQLAQYTNTNAGNRTERIVRQNK
jgi:hypothetical protein